MKHLLQIFVLITLSLTLSIVPSKPVFAEQAPDFSLYNEQGEVVRLSDYKGEPLIIHFWATWCPYCKKLQPGLDKLYKKYQPQGVNIIAISLWEDEGATPQAELHKRGMSFNTVINGEKISDKYGVKGTPTTIFISKNGDILWRTGLSDPNSPLLEKAVLEIIK